MSKSISMILGPLELLDIASGSLACRSKLRRGACRTLSPGRANLPLRIARRVGGTSGIRTLGPTSGKIAFETAPFDDSGNFPFGDRDRLLRQRDLKFEIPSLGNVLSRLRRCPRGGRDPQPSPAAVSEQSGGLRSAVPAETLLTIAADPRHLGAHLGFTAVLHSWGSAMTHHPHLHMIVPAGGISLDGTRWVPCRPGFFLPVRVLSRLFRRLFLAGLVDAHAVGRLAFFGEIEGLRRRKAFAADLAPLMRKKWFVYAKPPFAGPEAVLAY